MICSSSNTLLKDDIGSFVNLYTSAKAARMNEQHVNRLLAIANNDLPSVELRYERLKKEAATLTPSFVCSALIWIHLSSTAIVKSLGMFEIIF